VLISLPEQQFARFRRPTGRVELWSHPQRFAGRIRELSPAADPRRAPSPRASPSPAARSRPNWARAPGCSSAAEADAAVGAAVGGDCGKRPGLRVAGRKDTLERPRCGRRLRRQRAGARRPWPATGWLPPVAMCCARASRCARWIAATV
jgi:hypothetical protein